MSKVTGFIREVDQGNVPDATRREILLAVTGLMGGAGLVAASVPFVESLQPSALALARGGPSSLLPWAYARTWAVRPRCGCPMRR